MSVTIFETWSEQGRAGASSTITLDGDLELTEENGCISGADASKISERAIDRGYNQVGTLGSGIHYLEVQGRPPGGTCATASSLQNSGSRFQTKSW